MARTKPTTAAGAVALLEYITVGSVGLFDLGQCEWHKGAFQTVVASLKKITQKAA